jgi:hypothetical protein
MRDLRCLIGWHDWRVVYSGEYYYSHRIKVRCYRCHKANRALNDKQTERLGGNDLHLH